MRVLKIWAHDCHTWYSLSRRKIIRASQGRLHRWDRIKTWAFKSLLKRGKKNSLSIEWVTIGQFREKATRQGWVCACLWWNIPGKGAKGLEGKVPRCGSMGKSLASSFYRWLKDSIPSLCGPSGIVKFYHPFLMSDNMLHTLTLKWWLTTFSMKIFRGSNIFGEGLESHWIPEVPSLINLILGCMVRKDKLFLTLPKL